MPKINDIIETSFIRLNVLLLTFNGRSSNATVTDALTLKVISNIPLSGKPEFPQTDGKGKIFVNIED